MSGRSAGFLPVFAISRREKVKKEWVLEQGKQTAASNFVKLNATRLFLFFTEALGHDVTRNEAD